jgi:hypothetical protein
MLTREQIQNELQYAVDDGWLTEDALQSILNLSMDINDEDIALFVQTVLLDRDFEHTIDEIKKVAYNNESEQRMLESLGFDGAYRIWFKNGQTELYAWNYGSRDVTKIEWEKPEGKVNEKLVKKIQRLIIDAQYDGKRPFISYDCRHKYLDVSLDGDCIQIIYQAQEADPADVKDELIELLKARLPEFGKVEIWLDASDRNGHSGTYQLI